MRARKQSWRSVAEYYKRRMDTLDLALGDACRIAEGRGNRAKRLKKISEIARTAFKQNMKG